MSGDIVRITQEHRGREVPVPPGAEVELVLPENPTTGMRWILPLNGTITVLDDSYPETPKPTPGAATQRIFRLRLKPGKTHLVLRRGQEWNPDADPDAQFDVILKQE